MTRRFALAAVAAGAVLWAASAWAQAYPNRPVRIVAPLVDQTKN